MVRVAHQALLVFAMALAPFFVLLLRGVVWGADSFAFMSVACGNVGYVDQLGHLFFAQFVPLFGCNFLLICFCMFVFYFFGLLGLWCFGCCVLGRVDGFRLALYVGGLTPLFFIEALRFENELFGFSLGLVALGLFSIALASDNIVKKAYILFLCIVCYVFGVLFWFPTVLLVFPCFLLLGFSDRTNNFVLLGIIITFLPTFFNYIANTFLIFSQTSLIAEEIPLVGIVFILHILHFYKKIPKPFYFYGIFLLILGLLKSKYMFLAVPFLILGLIVKERDEGLEFAGVKLSGLVMSFVIITGLCISGVFLYPTTNDIQEAQQLIQLSKKNQTPIYNDWGDGWMFTWLGYETKYKISYPQPDWNNLDKPYYAWHKRDQLTHCNQIATHSWYCK